MRQADATATQPGLTIEQLLVVGATFERGAEDFWI